MHEYTHVIGLPHNEAEAWATSVDIAIKLQAFGGVQASLSPFSGMINNGQINYQGIESFLNARMTTPGDL